MIKMMGYSDDVLYLEYGTYADEIDCHSKCVEVEVHEGNTGTGLRATWRYGFRTAQWSVEIERLDEGAAIPWPVTIEEGDRPYSVALCIDANPETCNVGTKVFAMTESSDRVLA